jgi:hypothetical protein
MPQLSPAAVILLALGLVVLINGAVLLAARRSGWGEQLGLFRRAARRARDPWGAEQQALEELGRRVAQLSPPEGNTQDELPRE